MTNTRTRLALSPLTLVAALGPINARFVPFDDKPKPGWKLTEDGKGIAVDTEGNPIYIHSDGKEGAIKSDTISNLNAEAARNRVRAETAEEKLKTFDGIDPAKAREALETVKSISDGDLIKKGEAEKLRNDVKAQFEGTLSEKDKAIEAANQKLVDLQLGLAFNGSKFIGDKLAIPADIVRATFGSKFKVDANGNITAVASDGNPIMSKKNIGNVADFEEALEMIVENYPHKDAIMKGNNHQGSNNGGGGGNNNAGKKTYRRDEFAQLTPARQAEVASEVGEGKAVMLD